MNEQGVKTRSYGPDGRIFLIISKNAHLIWTICRMYLSSTRPLRTVIIGWSKAKLVRPRFVSKIDTDLDPAQGLPGLVFMTGVYLGLEKCPAMFALTAAAMATSISPISMRTPNQDRVTQPFGESRSALCFDASNDGCGRPDDPQPPPF